MKQLIIIEDMQPVIWATTVPFAVLCFATCAMRLYTRACVAKSFGADDWFMLVASPTWIGQQYIAWMWIVLGGGLHQEQVPDENVVTMYKYLFLEEFYYLFLQFLIKMSFLCFYRRVLCVTTRFERAVHAVMVLVFLQTIGTWIFYALQCESIEAFLYPEEYPEDACIESDLTYYLPTAVNVIMDFAIYAMAFFPLRKLQVAPRQRLKLYVIFVGGGATMVVSLLRFIVLWQLGNTTNVTYTFGSVTIVTSIEFDVAIITANLPGVAAFYHFFSSLYKSRRATGDTASKGTELDNIVTIGRIGRSKNSRTLIMHSRGDSEVQLCSQTQRDGHVECHVGDSHMRKERIT